MKRLGIVAALVALAGCGGSGSDNPAQLWLAPNGDELHVRLVSAEPHPF